MIGNAKWSQAMPIFALGVAVGAGLAILFAPNSGEETREQIAGSVLEGVDRATAKGEQWVRQAGDTAGQIKDRLRGAAEAGRHAYEEELRTDR